MYVLCCEKQNTRALILELFLLYKSLDPCSVFAGRNVTEEPSYVTAPCWNFPLCILFCKSLNIAAICTDPFLWSIRRMWTVDCTIFFICTAAITFDLNQFLTVFPYSFLSFILFSLMSCHFVKQTFIFHHQIILPYYLPGSRILISQVVFYEKYRANVW